VKKILIGVVLLVVVVAAALFFVMSSLDAIIAAAIEKYGAEATGAPVHVKTVEISLRSGEGSIGGLAIGSPPGFAAAHTFALGRIHVALDTATLTGNPVVVKEILIEEPHVIYEWSGRSTNLAAIQKNVDAFSARYAGDTKRAESEPAETAGAERKFVIQNLSVRGGRVEVAASLLADRSAAAQIPDIHVKDIGKQQGGATSAQVTAQILEVLLRAAGKGMAGIDVQALRGQAEAAAAEAANEAVDRGVQGAADALKGLLDR